MNFKIRRRLTYIVIACMFTFNGIEYAVIIPSIWSYLQHLGAGSTDLLGVTLASFSFASLLVGPIAGKWYDKSRNAKRITIVLNIFEIIGSGMYVFGLSPLFIVASRFVCGLGASAASAVLADVSNGTKLEERTSIIANFQACRQIGLLIGPALNLLLRTWHFRLGPYAVTKLNAPGLLMAGIGVIQEILFLTMYYNLAALSSHEKLTESLRHSCYGAEAKDNRGITNYGTIMDSCQTQSSVLSEVDAGCPDTTNANVSLQSSESVVAHANAEQPSLLVGSPVCHHLAIKSTAANSTIFSSNEMIENAEDYMSPIYVCAAPAEGATSPSHSSPSALSSIHTSNNSTFGSNSANSRTLTTSSRHMHWSEQKTLTLSLSRHLQPLTNEFLRDEVIVLLGLSFVSMFAQTSLETIVTPLTQKYFQFGDFENSLFFLFAGIEILFAFFLINVLSKKLEDRVMIFIGGIFMLFSLAWYLVFVPNFYPEDWGNLPYFAVGIIANLLGISFLVVCCISLYSKLISSENQGIGHGIRRTLLNAGMILGPLWGGASSNFPVLCFSVPLAVTSLFMVLFGFSYSRLKIDADRETLLQGAQTRCSSSWTINATENETAPLLYH